MSYILDAIKKADQKRKLGTVPDVHTIHEAPAAEPRRPGWVYGVAAILFVNAGVIGWWLWSGDSAKAPAVKPPAKAVAVRPEQKGPRPLPPRPVKVSPPPAQVAKAPTPTPPPASTQALPSPATPAPATQASIPAGSPPPAAQAMAPQSTPPVPQSPAAQATAAPPTPAPPPPAPATAAKMPVPPPPSATPPQAGSVPVVPVISEESPEESSEEESIAAAAGGEGEGEGALMAAEEGEDMAASEGEEVAAAAEGEALVPIASSLSAKEKVKKRRADREKEEDPELAKIPYLKQLPDETKQGLPELHISFHSYSIKPASRLVSIGGKILREGQDFDDSVKLETITVKGVVLVTNGRRFRLDVQ